MKFLGILLPLLALAASSVVDAGRLRRQSDGEFWWQTTVAPVADTAPVVEHHVPAEEVRTYPEEVPEQPYDTVPVDPNTGCVCVPYYLCNDGSVITDGAGIIDIRVLPRNISTRTGALPQCEGFLDVCCNLTDDTVTVAPPPVYTPRCGNRNSQGVHVRISGPGIAPTDAQFGEFPWMTAVLRKEQIGDKSLNLYICGGSLIEPNVILTAAHCVSKHQNYASNLLVRLGEWNTQDTNEPYEHQDIAVSHVIVHPEFNPGALYNDYALLILSEPAILSPHVDTVCLPPVGYDYSGYRCFATGWGKNEFGAEGTFQNILKLIDLPVVDNYECEQSLRTTRLGKYFRLHDSFMCAGGEPHKDTCKGDGGSPLVCAIPSNDVGGLDTYEQAGIVAWGIGCGENGVPGVYASVSDVVPWIDAEIAPYVYNLA